MKQDCEQNHYVIVEAYIDKAKSATANRRPSFHRMIADSKQHLFDIVLVHKLERYQKLIRFAKVEGFVYGDVTGMVFHMPFRAEKADKIMV